MRRGTRQERGAALIIALLVVSIMAFLGGVLLLMSQGETRISSNMRQATVALTTAEAGLETIVNQLPQTTAASGSWMICDGLKCTNVNFYSGAGKTLGQTTAVPITPLGPQAPAAGYNLETTGWNGYLIYSTGISTSFLVFVNQMAELQTTTVVGQMCRGTDYTCS